MAIARLSGGPLDGQVIPLDDIVGDAYIAAYSEGQIVYRRAAADAAEGDGPAEELFVFAESTEPIDPTAGDEDDFSTNR